MVDVKEVQRLKQELEEKMLELIIEFQRQAEVKITDLDYLQTCTYTGLDIIRVEVGIRL